MRVSLLVLVAACGLVAGCGGGGSGPSNAGPLVRYHRTGGLAGGDVTLVVHGDGRATRTERRPSGSSTTSARYSAERLAALRRALAAADLAHQPSSDAPAPPDGYVYEITAGGHTVRAVEGSVPRPIVPLIALLDGRAYAA